MPGAEETSPTPKALKSASEIILENHLKAMEEAANAKKQADEKTKELASTLLAQKKRFFDHVKSSAEIYENIQNDGALNLAKMAENTAMEVDVHVARSTEIAKSLTQVRIAFQTLKDKLAKADELAAALHDFVRREQKRDIAVKQLMEALGEGDRFGKIKSFGKKIEDAADKMNEALLSIPAGQNSIDLSELKKKAQELKTATTAFSKETGSNLDFSRDQLKKSNTILSSAISALGDAEHNLRISENEIISVNELKKSISA